MKERNHAFDLLCGLCILRMITLHCVSLCGFRGCTMWFDKLMAWSFFFICFFFFKAGYFNKSISAPTKFFLKDKFKRLLIPYLAWGAIGSLLYFGMLFLFPGELHRYWDKFSWSHIWTQSHFYGNRPTWFLFSFFVTYLVVHFIEKVKGLRWIAVLFPLVSYLLFLYGNPLWMDANNVFMGIFFFYLGMLWKHIMKRFSRSSIIIVSIVMIIAFLVLNVVGHGEYTMSINSFKGSFLMTMLIMVLAICGLVGFFSSVNLPRVPVICYIGQHSMVYFISHYPMLYFYKFMHLSFGRSIWNRPEEVFILIPAVFCLCTWMVPLIERIPWLSGRWKRPLPALPTVAKLPNRSDSAIAPLGEC